MFNKFIMSFPDNGLQLERCTNKFTQVKSIQNNTVDPSTVH